MRASLSVGLILAALNIAAPLWAQPKNDKETPTALTTRAVLARLQVEVDAAPFRRPMKFKEFLSLLSEKLEAKDRSVPLEVDLDAFADRDGGGDAPSPFEADITLNTNRRRIPAIDLLNQAVRPIARDGGGYVIRGGRVEIVPGADAARNVLLNYPIRADFKDQRLDLALQELSDLSGASIVVDARARQKAQTTVTARFNGDVALQDAVRMLTDMAELKIVYLVTGIYITTPEHAQTMQKELRKIYGEPETPAGQMPVNPMGPPPSPNVEPPESPLAPPFPRWPRGRIRGELAA